MIEVIKAFDLGKLDYPIVIAEVKAASCVLDEVLTEAERNELIDTLAFHPEMGEPLVGFLHRVRKLKWRYGVKRKRSMLRVIYFFYDLNMPLYVVAVYKRGEVFRLTNLEEEAMLKLTDELVAIHARRNFNVARGHGLSA